MRHIYRFVIIACVISTAAIGVEAADDSLAVRPDRKAALDLPPITLSADLWYTMGESSWEIFFGEIDAGVGPFIGTSRLEFEDLDGPVFVLSADAQLLQWLSLRGRVGFGEADDGEGTDTDFILAPRSAFGQSTISESRFDTDSDIENFDISLHARVSEWGAASDQGHLEVFIGYQHAEEELRLRNGVQSIITDDKVSRTFDDILDSRFDFEWSGLRIGAGTAFQFNETIWLEMSAAYLADVDYDGEGFWNLRDDLKATAPNFVQSGGSGDGFDVEIAVTVAELFENVNVRAGYRWTEWQVDGGQDRVFTAAGEVLSTSLSEATSERHGFFIGAGIDL
ncbi:MAG: hypothetical protein O3C10_04585 [Chloroflexi bacterium]|nr:hypothetical protein [Chloroflexota bacterium]